MLALANEALALVAMATLSAVHWLTPPVPATAPFRSWLGRTADRIG